jgi:transcriptional regulator GlxA family with amidase domain
MRVTIEIQGCPSVLESVFKAMIKTKGNLSVVAAAKMLFLSADRFRHKFKELSGVSYRAACLNIKLDIAKTLLETTTWSVAEIAAELGYSERSKLERSFKRAYGFTPVQYRNLGFPKKAI